MTWDHPVYEPPTPETDDPNATVAVAPRKALPLDAAFDFVAGEDPRPLLVLRECLTCAGTERALLNVDENNEKTLLLSKWFHCVKLPVHVTEEDHPFHNFWRKRMAKDHVPHLFLASPDGESILPLRGDQSQTELHGAMLEMLERSYARDAERPVREITKLLARFDHIDSMERLLRGRFDDEIEKNGPGSSKLRKIKRDLDALARDREKLEERYEKLLELPLRRGSQRAGADQGQARSR